MLSYHVANGRCTFLYVFLGQFLACFFEWIKILEKHAKQMQILHEKETPAQR